MTGLSEQPNWRSEIYQIEQTDPVLGGEPNEDTKAGLVNIPALQLAERTLWLKEQVALLAAAGYVTQAEINAAISSLLGGAPAALDTLKELSDALGDSDDAIAALTAQVAGKLNASSYTAADILAKLLTVDGSGSGLDADKLDGLSSGDFARSARVITAGTGLSGGGDLGGNRTISADIASEAEALAGTTNTKLLTPLRMKAAIDAAIAALLDGAPAALDTLKELSDALGDSDDAIAALTAQVAGKLNASSYTAADVLAKLLTVDGGGSGLDADKLDGQSSSYYARSARVITAGTGLSGGGDLGGNRTISADIASEAEAIAGAINTKLLTPLRMKERLAGAAFGAIGTEAYAARYGPEIVAGNIYQGGELRPAGFNALAFVSDNSVAAANSSQFAVGSGTLAGSWLALGSVNYNPASDYTRSTMFRRIY